MLRFFRLIRHRLLAENRLRNYLLYAAGEILLVVIGILIALQINAWSEERQLAHSIKTHLTVLSQNIKEDQVQLQALRSTMTQNRMASDSAFLQMKTLIPVDPALKTYLLLLILEHEFRPNTNAFQTLTQSNEIPFLQQDLQTALLNYYALIARTNEREHISNTHIQSKFEPYITNHYPETFQKDNEFEFLSAKYADDPRPLRAIDPETFLADAILETLLVSRNYQATQLERFYGELLEASERILELIEPISNE